MEHNMIKYASKEVRYTVEFYEKEFGEEEVLSTEIISQCERCGLIDWKTNFHYLQLDGNYYCDTCKDKVNYSQEDIDALIKYQNDLADTVAKEMEKFDKELEEKNKVEWIKVGDDGWFPDYR